MHPTAPGGVTWTAGGSVSLSRLQFERGPRRVMRNVAVMSPKDHYGGPTMLSLLKKLFAKKVQSPVPIENVPQYLSDSVAITIDRPPSNARFAPDVMHFRARTNATTIDCTISVTTVQESYSALSFEDSTVAFFENFDEISAAAKRKIRLTPLPIPSRITITASDLSRIRQ
jgi:hypothetical protein